MLAALLAALLLCVAAQHRPHFPDAERAGQPTSSTDSDSRDNSRQQPRPPLVRPDAGTRLDHIARERPRQARHTEGRPWEAR